MPSTITAFMPKVIHDIEMVTQARANRQPGRLLLEDRDKFTADDLALGFRVADPRAQHQRFGRALPA